jgi:hypothetical protein
LDRSEFLTDTIENIIALVNVPYSLRISALGREGDASCEDIPPPPTGRVENWRAHGRRRVSNRALSIRAVGSQFRRGHVSSSRLVKRSGRISRTPLSCPLSRKVYEAYHAGSAFGASRGRRTRYWLNSPNPS